MRIVWKDTAADVSKACEYRGFEASGHRKGWTTNIPNDMNIYKTKACALNAIDKYIGDYGKNEFMKKRNYGINVIGQQNTKRTG